MNNILAIDNSTNYLSIAYAHTKQSVENINFDNVYHNIHINNASNHILDAINNIVKNTIPNYIAVGIGPGAFTGVRLACSIAMGLAMAWDIKVIPICSLNASIEYFRYINNLAEFKGRILLDARMQELYSSFFSYEAQIWNIKNIELISNQQAFADEQIFTNLDTLINNSIINKVQVHALGVLNLAFDNLQQACLPEQISPNYIRNKVALTISERKK